MVKYLLIYTYDSKKGDIPKHIILILDGNPECSEQMIAMKFNQYFVNSINSSEVRINRKNRINYVYNTTSATKKSLVSFKLLSMRELKRIVRSMRNTNGTTDDVTSHRLY